MAESLEALLQKYGPSDLPFEQWKQEANKIRFFGQTKEDIFDILGYPVEFNDVPIKVTYKGDKIGYDRRTGNREKQTTVRSSKASVQTVGEDVYNKGVVAPKGSGLQEHHKRVMDVYAPFFEGLEPKEQKELAQWFVDEGAPLGNVQKNLVGMTPENHERLHNWLKQNYIQSKTGKPLINLQNLSLNERFVPALTFLEQIQPAIDEQTTKFSKLPVKTVSKSAVKPKLGGLSFIKSAAKAIPGPLDDVPLSAVAGGIAAGASLLSGGTPAQAGEIFGQTAVDTLTDPVGSAPGTGEMYYPDGMERNSPEGLARAKREQQETFDQQIKQPVKKFLNLLGGAMRYLPSGIGI